MKTHHYIFVVLAVGAVWAVWYYNPGNIMKR